MQLTGKIKLILDIQKFESGFQKREFVVTTQEQYPQDIKFECIKDKLSMLESLSAGDDITIDFNIRGNEFKGKYYVNLQAWKIESVSAGSKRQAEAPTADAPDMPAAGSGDDLPF